jgi:hypothetical protein
MRCQRSRAVNCSAVLALPARPGILPILLAHRPFNRTLDPLGQAQLEQIWLMRIRRQLEEFKRRMLRNAIEQRAGVNSSAGGYIPFGRVSKNGK